MNYKLITIPFTIFAMSLISCHVSMPNHDLTVINNTNDTLYYYVGSYKFKDQSVANMAFERMTDMKTNKTIDTIMGYTFNPGDMVHPSKMDTSWKTFAGEKGGITILFYKKEIEKLPARVLLSTKDIYKKIDLTRKQLDSLKYKIVLN